MTQEEILECNKTIAEFMYPNAKQEYASGEIDITDGIYKKAMFIFDNIALMKYHNSYDWLMLVVEKIESLPMVEYFEISHRIKIGIYSDNYVISLWRNEDGFGAFRYLPDDSDLVPILSIQGKNQISKIEAIWLAVIEFIKWYNLNKE